VGKAGASKVAVIDAAYAAVKREDLGDPPSFFGVVVN